MDLFDYEFQLSDFGLEESATSPVRSALARVFIGKWNAVCAALSRTTELSKEAETTTAALRELRSASPLIGDCVTLFSWLNPPIGALSKEDALRHALRLREAGIENHIVEEVFLLVQQRHAGRPHQRERYICRIRTDVGVSNHEFGQSGA